MKKLILSLVLGIMLLSFTAGFNTNTFSNNLTTENLTFTGTNNFTRYLEIPSTITQLTNMYFNLSSLTTWTYVNSPDRILQETPSPLINAVSYDNPGEFGNNVMPFVNLTLISIQRLYTNPGENTKPSCKVVNSSGSVVASSIFVGSGEIKSCYVYYNLTAGKEYSLLLNGTGSYAYKSGGIGYPLTTGPYLNWTNGTSPFNHVWSAIDTITVNLNTQLTLNSSINNTNITLGGDTLYSYPGLFNQTNNKTINLAGIINKYLNVTYLNGSYYYLPFVFTSTGGGILNYSDIIVNDNLSVNTINLTGGSCASGLNTSYTFNLYNEENFTAINGTFAYNFNIGFNEINITIYGKVTNSNTLNLCLNMSGFTNASSFKINYGEIQYSVTNFADRRYYVFSGERLVDTTITIPLYSLATTSATSFLVTAQTTALVPYQNYYVGLLRWYPQLDEYKIVDMGKTDDKGQTVLRVKTEDVDYRLALYQPNGILVKMLSPIRLICQTSPCTYSLFADATTTDLTLWNNIQRSLTFDSTTNIFTFTWNDPSQIAQVMNLTVYRDTATASDIVCNTVGTGYTGIITCDISAYTGNFRAEVRRTASPVTVIAQLTATIKELFSDIAGGEGGVLGLFIGVVLLIFFAMIGIFSPTIVIILAVVSLFPMVVLGSMSWAVFTAIGVIGGLILHFMRRVS